MGATCVLFTHNYPATNNTVGVHSANDVDLSWQSNLRTQVSSFQRARSSWTLWTKVFKIIWVSWTLWVILNGLVDTITVMFCAWNQRIEACNKIGKYHMHVFVTETTMSLHLFTMTPLTSEVIIQHSFHKMSTDWLSAFGRDLRDPWIDSNHGDWCSNESKALWHQLNLAHPWKSVYNETMKRMSKQIEQINHVISFIQIKKTTRYHTEFPFH